MIVVLVVSSEGRVCRHIRSVLGSQGWWVATAEGREEAVRAAADQQPGLVIVDCEVEGAAELVRTFGAKNGGPGVLLLEPPGGEDAFFAFEAGADQILSKPPRAQALLEAAERVMSLPYQSSVGKAPDLGEKLSASEIFGEVLMELDATAPGPGGVGSEPENGRQAAALAAPKAATAAEPKKMVEAGSPGVKDSGAAVPDPPVGGAEASAESSFRFDPKTLGIEAGGEGSTVEPAPDTESQAAPPAPAPAALEAPSSAPATSLRPEAVEPPVREAPSSEPAPIPPPEATEPEVPETRSPGSPETQPATTVEPEAPEHRAVASGESERGTDDGRFGQYRLDERIAVGGMAEVWRASMLGLEGFRKTVAIKKILPHLAENDEFVTMFIEEAKLAARLSHENLVEIYDLGKIGESYFIAMEYVDGKDLRGLMNRLRQLAEQMPISLALLIAADVARGLEYAHTREDGEGRPLDLVHRDVSPRNVLIGHDGRVRLCDFGVAKAVSSVIQTQIGALKGKLQYMSPEQASGRPVDHRSDIYSLGSVMYEMVSGRRIYEEDNEISLLDAARAGNFDDPRKHCPGLSEEVRRILIKALAKKPAARYQSAGALEEDLRGLLRTLEPSPDSHALGQFVKRLFAARTGGEAVGAAESGSATVGPPASAGPGDATRSLQALRPGNSSKIARFWWGVVAGLLVAGMAAALLSLFSS